MLALQFSLDGTSQPLEYTSATLLNGFPVHAYMITLLTLSVLYIIGFNLCCPTLFMLCRRKKKVRRRPPRPLIG